MDDDSELDVSELSEPASVRLLLLCPLLTMPSIAAASLSELSLLFSDAMDTVDAQLEGGGVGSVALLVVVADPFIPRRWAPTLHSPPPDLAGDPATAANICCSVPATLVGESGCRGGIPACWWFFCGVTGGEMAAAPFGRRSFIRLKLAGGGLATGTPTADANGEEADEDDDLTCGD